MVGCEGVMFSSESFVSNPKVLKATLNTSRDTTEVNILFLFTFCMNTCFLFYLGNWSKITMHNQNIYRITTACWDCLPQINLQPWKIQRTSFTKVYVKAKINKVINLYSITLSQKLAIQQETKKVWDKRTWETIKERKISILKEMNEQLFNIMWLSIVTTGSRAEKVNVTLSFLVDQPVIKLRQKHPKQIGQSKL